MTKIKDILTLNLQEDIKNVIDLEDHAELEIQQEIESYIVTYGIAGHLDRFINYFSSHIKETGVWISGFYGSGKSYFGKMLGYILDNPIIVGTSARERFIHRLRGVSSESLLENSIRGLDAIPSRVIFLDIAKQNTDRGLAFTLFINFLKRLGFRDDIYGYMEFDLLIDGKLNEFKEIVKRTEKQEWDKLKTSNRQVARAMRNAFMEMGYCEADYADTHHLYNLSIENFSATKFKSELEKYTKYKNDETLVFIFDEASEAIGQKKFTMLELEGISEALSSISSKVWTIAIAQEKLDDIINNANVNKSQLTKVTDRFKTKIHLESTEVDVIIRSRLLHKTVNGYQQLLDYYQSHEGLVADATNLKSPFPTKTADSEEFTVYYPFHKYQFDILQKFLFNSNALVATQIAARGMIITTFDVLRKQMREEELFNFVSGFSICSEAQTSPPSDLVNKYDTAKKILKERNSSIDGANLLKTIHLLTDSEVVSPTVENITKCYISDIATYYNVKPAIEEALALLLEAKALLLSNHNYKITSNLEGKLLDEMKDYDVELFNRKRMLIASIKEYKLFTSITSLNDGSDNFKFSVQSEQEDDLAGPGSKELRLTVYSLFNITENRQDFIENLKTETQQQKDRMILIPDNRDFSIIDKLIGEISRYTYIEDKYRSDSDPIKRQIIRDFSIIREEKAKELRLRIEYAYYHALLIYMYDENLLNPNDFKSRINEIQRKMIKNIYTKRLSSNLSEGLALKILTSSKVLLHSLFSSDDFKFFDTRGNFIGDHLKVVEEIHTKIRNRYIDGRSLELDLAAPPWGYSFGAILSTLAALFRSGRLSIKYNGDTWFSPENKAIHEVFANTTKFRSAAFKSICDKLTAAQKKLAVQLLLDLEIESYTNKKVNWDINDFELAYSIYHLAEHFIKALTTLSETVDQFEILFPGLIAQKQILSGFTGIISESNYLEKVERFLLKSDLFKNAIQTIQDARQFIKKHFSNVKEYKRFIEEVNAELKKSDCSDGNIMAAAEEFMRLYRQDMVRNFAELRQQAQTVKDCYYALIKTAAMEMSRYYQRLLDKINTAAETLKEYPTDLNAPHQRKLDDLKRYCTDRIVGEPLLEYSINCRNCDYSLSDMLNYSALIPAKENEWLIIQSSFIAEGPRMKPDAENGIQPVTSAKKPRKINIRIPGKIIKVREYKSFLAEQLTSLAASRPDEEIELELILDESVKETQC